MLVDMRVGIPTRIDCGLLVVGVASMTRTVDDSGCPDHSTPTSRCTRPSVAADHRLLRLRFSPCASTTHRYAERPMARSRRAGITPTAITLATLRMPAPPVASRNRYVPAPLTAHDAIPTARRRVRTRALPRPTARSTRPPTVCHLPPATYNGQLRTGASTPAPAPHPGHTEASTQNRTSLHRLYPCPLLHSLQFLHRTPALHRYRNSGRQCIQHRRPGSATPP